MATSHSIVIVDDHVLIAQALAGIIRQFHKYEVLYEVPHGKALIERLQQGRNVPDIVLLDITMPVMDGFETAAWLSANHPEVKILALSMQDDEQSLLKMIRAGANGYILKNVHPLELEKALDSTVENGIYYSDAISGKVLLNLARHDAAAEAALTINKRELEFLQFAATELTYKEIADKMCCSPRTVESYRDGLFVKTGLKTRIGLVVYAIKKGLIKV
jgi:DNA-binding NarL/FixJ family response regulator